MGSRSASNEKAAAWVKTNGKNASQGTFSEAAASGEIIFNCVAGSAALEVLKLAGAENMNGKILIDLTNPLDFSKGMPPTLSICNTSSLAEEIQKTFPEVKVVKTLNTMWCGLMVNPGMINNADHNVFLSGNDEEAKKQVRELLKSFGWPEKILWISVEWLLQGEWKCGFLSGLVFMAQEKTGHSTSKLWAGKCLSCFQYIGC